MFAATKQNMGSGTGPPVRGTQDDARLRHDRVVGAVALVVFLALMALVVWLATLGVQPNSVNYDYWLVP